MVFWKKKKTQPQVGALSEGVFKVVESALAELESGNPQDAYLKLVPGFRNYKELADNAADLSGLLLALSKVGKMIVGEKFRNTLAAAASDIGDARALLNAGDQMIELGIGSLALAPLYCAHRLRPHDAQIVSELCVAFDDAGLNRDAVELLRSTSALLQEHFVLRYLLGFNAVMAGDITTARRTVVGLGEPSSDHESAMVSNLSRFLSRADALDGRAALDDQDLRGWHYVLHGGVVTHLSPYGFNEGMFGRYAMVQDSYELCLEGITRLKKVLSAWDCPPASVVAAPDRSSQILAHAIGERLGIAIGTSLSASGHQLVVAYDLGSVDPSFMQAMHSREPNQVLFSHCVSWTDPPAFSPDICTYFYQVQTAPWDLQLRVTRDGQTEQTPPDGRSVEELAQEILKTELEALDDVTALGDFASALTTTAPCLNDSNKRGRWWGDGPVKSSRFM